MSDTTGNIIGEAVYQNRSWSVGTLSWRTLARNTFLVAVGVMATLN